MRPRTNISLTLTLLCGLLACGVDRFEPPPPREPPAWTPADRQTANALGLHVAALPSADGPALTIRLAFDSTVDLDLYVTGPSRETIYFGNSSSRSGGGLVEDQTCSNTGGAVRVEEIAFPRPSIGSYRIGVDFPEACDVDDSVAPFALAVDHAGRREIRTGLAELHIFQPVVVEESVAR